MAPLHRPTRLALLISLIGVSAASGAHASAPLAVPLATARDITRWAPASFDEEPEIRSAIELSVEGLLRRDVPAPVESSPSTRQSPLAEETERWSVEVEDAPPLNYATVADAPAHRPGTLAKNLKARLKDAAASLGNAARKRLGPRIQSVAEPTTLVEAPSVEAPPTPQPEWLSQLLEADELPLSVADAPSPWLAARIAARFPAAVDAAQRPDTPNANAGRRTSRALLAQRRDVVVAATQAEKVLHTLDAVMHQGSDDLIVTTHAEKVLATLIDVAKAQRAIEVRAKRDAYRALQRTAVRKSLPADAITAAPPVVQAMGPEPVAAMGVVDIDLDALAVTAVAAPVPAIPIDAVHPLGGRRVALGEATLDRVRGGFVTPGLNVSFGIERAVYVNGTLVTSTSLNVSELGRISGGAGQAPLDATTLGLIQSGAGNVVAAGTLSQTNLGTVVQNTLDGQNIRSLTVINATVNSLGVLRGLNLQSSMRGAVIDSLRR